MDLSVQHIKKPSLFFLSVVLVRITAVRRLLVVHAQRVPASAAFHISVPVSNGAFPTGATQEF